MRFDSKCNFVPLPSFWGFVLGRGISFFGGIQHSPADGFQQQVVISEFLQKMSAHPSTRPSCRCFRDKTGW